MMKKQLSLKLGIIRLAHLLDEIAKLVLLGVMLLIIANIFMRALFQNPITGSYDLVSLFIGIVVVLALANCAVEKGHVAIDFLADRFPDKIQKFIVVTMNVISFIFIGLFAYHVAQYAHIAAIAGDESFTLKIPHYPFIYIISLGYLLLSLVILTDLCNLIKDVLKR